MTRTRERRPKVFPGFNPGTHFDPYYDKQKDEHRAHERGKELKTLIAMGERNKTRDPLVREFSNVSKAPVTLPSLKWMKP
jgi:hypothetical protein